MPTDPAGTPFRRNLQPCQQRPPIRLNHQPIPSRPIRWRKLKDDPSLRIPAEILGSTWDDVVAGNYLVSSSAEILDYYFRPKRPLLEAKLILVGRGSVGKTSLVNRLVHNTFGKERKTEGIKITGWGMPLTGGDDAHLNVWDFGGQEIMHATHQFFLTRRSVADGIEKVAAELRKAQKSDLADSE